MFNIWALGVKTVTPIIVLTIAIYGIYSIVKGNAGGLREKRTKRVAMTTAGIVVLFIGSREAFYAFPGNALPIQVHESAKEYIINVDEVKKSDSGTSIKINYVLLDINNVAFSLGVKGKDKLVAVEVKESLESNKSLGEINNQWVGRRFKYEPQSMSTGFYSDTFKSPIYIVCHLSNGEEISFEIEDKNNVKDKVKIIKLNEVLKGSGRPITVKEFVKGINFSSLELSTDISLHDLEVSMLTEGKEYSEFQAYGTSGMLGYSMPPVGQGEVVIRIKVKDTGNEYRVRVQ
jgi:hypothetical protein